MSGRTDEPVAGRRDELRSVAAVLFDVVVEVVNSLREPHEEHKERSDAYTHLVNQLLAACGEAGIPIMKPMNPIQAVARWIWGRSNIAPALPRNARCAVNVNMKRKITVRAREMAMKTGVVAVGASSKSGALEGNTDRSMRTIQSQIWVL